MAVETGQRTTGNIASSQRTIDMAQTISLLEPDAAPLTVITKRSSKMGTSDPLFSWHNDQGEARFDAVNNGAGYDNAVTSIVVDTGTAFAADDIVLVPRTGEILSITSISTNTLTVGTRGAFGSAAAAIVDNDPLLIIGTAAEEGSRSPEPRAEDPTKVDNWTQIFKTTVEVSGTLGSSANESSPHVWGHEHNKQGIEHKKDIEYAGLFGEPISTTGANGKPRRLTGGLNNYLTQNRQDAGGALTETEWLTWMRTLRRYGSSKKTVFASPLVVSVLEAFALGKYQVVNDKAATYGVSVNNYISGGSSVSIVEHPLLEGAVFGGYAFAVDFGSGGIKYRYLSGGPFGPRDTKLHLNRQEADRDAKRDEWITECGFQVGNPYLHGVLYGVTS